MVVTNVIVNSLTLEIHFYASPLAISTQLLVSLQKTKAHLYELTMVNANEGGYTGFFRGQRIKVS